MNNKSKAEQIFILVMLAMIVFSTIIFLTGCSIGTERTTYGEVSSCGGCKLGPIIGSDSSICRFGDATGCLPNAMSCGTAAGSCYIDCTLGNQCFGCYRADGNCAVRAFGCAMCNEDIIDALDLVERLSNFNELYRFIDELE